MREWLGVGISPESYHQVDSADLGLDVGIYVFKKLHGILLQGQDKETHPQPNAWHMTGMS
jgi:hypothetical protein